MDKTTSENFRQEFTENDLECICTLLCAGVNVLRICAENCYDYGSMVNWVYSDEGRKAKYEEALVRRGDWLCHRIIKELEDVGLMDVGEMYDGNGVLKSMGEMSEAARRAISGIDVEERDDDGVGVTVRKVKVWDKLKALEMMGKTQAMFRDRVDVGGVLTLEDLVMGSIGKDSDGGGDSSDS